MISTLFHNKVLTKEPSRVKIETIKTIEASPAVSLNSKKNSISYSGAASGGMFGLGLGIGDALYSNYAQRRDINRSLNNFKNSSFELKKAAILNLHNSGMTVKDYKKSIQTFLETPVARSVIKRGALYAAIAAVGGFVIHQFKSTKNQ